MSRERDINRKMFHKGHYEVIAARFREQVSEYATLPVLDDEDIESADQDVEVAASLRALRNLAQALAERFEFDNDIFERNIFLERCGFIV